MTSNLRSVAWILSSVVVLTVLAPTQVVDSKLYQDMRWRLIGPFRGGRSVAIAGIPSKPNVFFMAPNNGGVWKTIDYGRTWNPIFDDQPSGSVGALAIAPSNPDIIYVGSGEGLRRPDLSTGDGIYKSTDGGRTWQHLGLRDGQQIGAILVDPLDPNRLFVAVVGHPYGPNAERGVFRSLDGGLNWEKVLYKDENTGAIDLAFDASNAQIIYADMWASRRPPWTTGNSYKAPGSGLYKSVDGGTTWRRLTKGLPTWSDQLGRIGLGVALSDARRSTRWWIRLPLVVCIAPTMPARIGSASTPTNVFGGEVTISHASGLIQRTRTQSMSLIFPLIGRPMAAATLRR